MISQVARCIRYCVVIMAVLVVVGCASLDPQVVQNQTRAKTIAVASVLGPNLGLKWVGTTVFNQEEGEVAVPAWEIDEHATKAASSGLLKTGRYTAVTELSNVKQVGEAVPTLPADVRADFLLLIKSSDIMFGSDPMYGTNQSFRGLGVAQRSMLGLKLMTKAHVGVKIELFDLATGRSIGALGKFEHWPINARLKSGGGSMTMNSYPVPRIDLNELEELRPQMKAKLVEVIDQLLVTMGLR